MRLGGAGFEQRGDAFFRMQRGSGQVPRLPVRLVVQAPDIRNDYKKCAGSSDAAKTYDTTAT